MITPTESPNEFIQQDTQPIAETAIKELDLSDQEPQKKSRTTLYIILIAIVSILSACFYYLVYLPSQQNNGNEDTATISKSTDAETTEAKGSATSMELSVLFDSLLRVYPESVPWVALNSREAYQFFPNEIKGLPLTVDEIGVIVDTEFNPLTTFNLNETTTLPLKSAYVGYYEIPEALADQYKVNKSEVIFPIELKTYEFDRALKESELTVMKSPSLLNCFNKEAEIVQDLFENGQVILSGCALNPTVSQREKSPDLFDHVYVLFFKDKNILVQVGINSQYAQKPAEYINDYFLKLFSSNKELFIKENQIRTAAERRSFEEWRSKTFDNQ